MTQLINRVAAAAGRKLLVLDDYHVLHTPAIHQAIVFLVEHTPPTLRLAISSRADPPLPLARWRARRDLTELREADLRFRVEEAHEFLTAIMGVALTGQEVVTLEQRTEGWIAGLQLAALSMQGADDLARRVARFAGGHIFIGDYLAEEVLQRQPPDIQQFLLDTAILPRLCGDLCQAVTGRGDSAAVLAALERGHLFLIPLDDERVWYRYHHLFAEMLRSRGPGGEREAALHCRAAEWHLRHDNIGEAIHHALAAGSPQGPYLAAGWLEEHRRRFQQAGEYVTLAGWLQQLPPAVFDSRPQLCLLAAKTHMFLHDLDAAEAWLVRTRQVLAATPGLDPDAAVLTAAIIVQCDIALNRCELESAIDLAQQALALMPSSAGSLWVRQRGETLMLLGVTHFWRSDYGAAWAACVEAGNAAAAAGDRLMMVYARGNAARILFQQGRLHAAAAALHAIEQEAARHGGMDLPLYAGCHLALAELYCEWNQLETVQRHVTTSQALARQGGNPRTLLHSYIHALRLLWAQNRLAESLATAAESEALIRQVALPRRIVEAFTYAAVRVALAAGDEARVDAWLATVNGQPSAVTSQPSFQPPAPGEEHLRLLLARVWAARGAYAEALDLLAKLQAVVEARQMGRLALETQVCRAAVLAAAGQHEAASQSLAAALTRAAPEGFVRLFVEEGEVLAGLLARLLPQLTDEGLRGYATRLLAAFPAMSAPRGFPPPGAPVALQPFSAATGQDPLSPRELEVLRLVDRGLSDRAVAEQLVVVTGTVKRHLSNIYGKLGVRSRTQALARARSLGWLK
jgi:LuxR family maltose regulon positive regulatory protein